MSILKKSKIKGKMSEALKEVEIIERLYEDTVKSMSYVESKYDHSIEKVRN